MRDKFWHPSKKEIQGWVEQKEQEFADRENINPKMSSKKWLQQYIFEYQYKIFFGSFPMDLYEWNSRLMERELF